MTKKPLMNKPLMRPHAGWAVLLFAFYVACFVFYPDGVFSRFRAPDPDDYLRLLRVRQLMEGQGWHDQTALRLDGGAAVMWSRAADVPLAFFAWALRPVLGAGAALECAALLLPLFLTFILLFVARAMARPFVPRSRSVLAPLAVLGFAGPLLYQFNPARVDHHAFQILAAGIGVSALARMVVLPKAAAPPVWAALAFACSLWIGIESLPVFLVFVAILGFFATIKGGAFLDCGVRFSGLFMLFSALILPLARAPQDWARFEVTWFSSAYLLMAVLVFGLFLSLRAAGRKIRKKPSRYAFSVALGFFFCALFFWIVPDMAKGPYANAFPSFSGTILDHVREARPFLPDFSHVRDVRSALGFLPPLFAPLTACGAAALFCVTGKGKRRKQVLFLALVFLAMFLAMALFWQNRVLAFAQLFSVPLIVWLIVRWEKDIDANFLERWKKPAKIAIFAGLVLMPFALFRPILQVGPLFPDKVLFYALARKKTCDLGPMAVFLSDSDKVGKKPVLILNIPNDGPEILYRTPHKVLAAPYNIKSNETSLAFFSARDFSSAHALAQKAGAEYVVVCRSFPPFMAGITPKTALRLRPVTTPSGRLVFRSEEDPSLAEALVQGREPAWLSRIDAPKVGDYLLFKIEKDIK